MYTTIPRLIIIILLGLILASGATQWTDISDDEDFGGSGFPPTEETSTTQGLPEPEDTIPFKYSSGGARDSSHELPDDEAPLTLLETSDEHLTAAQDTFRFLVHGARLFHTQLNRNAVRTILEKLKAVRRKMKAFLGQEHETIEDLEHQSGVLDKELRDVEGLMKTNREQQRLFRRTQRKHWKELSSLRNYLVSAKRNYTLLED